MKKKLLLCIQTLEIGGPQKSLLSLLYAIDYGRYDVSLMIWSGQGALIRYLPKEVNVIELPAELAFLRLSVDQLKRNSLKLMRRGYRRLVLSSWGTALRHRKTMTAARQTFWLKNRERFPMLDGEYDIAVAVTGGNLCYFVCDCVRASSKFTWVRSDYRVFHRDKLIDGIYFQQVDGILTVSNLAKGILQDEFPEVSDKIQVFYNLLPFQLYEHVKDESPLIPVREGQLMFVTIARLDRNKGFDLALDTAVLLRDRGMDFTWFFVGEGEYRQDLERLIRKKGLKRNVVMVGFKFNTYKCIQQCDAFVHPSRFEGKSNSVDEAKHACKPIVVTNYPTVAEQIEDGKTGLVVPYDARNLAEAIENVCSDAALRQRLQAGLAEEKKQLANSIEPLYKIIEQDA